MADTKYKSIEELDELIKTISTGISIASEKYKENNNIGYIEWEIKTKHSLLELLSNIMLDINDKALKSKDKR